MPRLPRVPASCVRSNLLHQLLILATLFLCTTALYAGPANRLQQGADLARMQPLPNHHPLWANAANDSGPVPTGQPLNQLTLVLARSAEQEAAFVKFLADQQNPASPDYHHWLIPAEVGERFGISDSDIAAITGWLQSQGLQVNWIAPSHLFIGFGGTAANIGRAFQTQLRTYRINGAQRMSVASDPLVPQALAPVIKSIRGLYAINEQPAHHTSDLPLSSPELTANSTTHYITPADFAVIYDVPISQNGSGNTIGIIGWSRTNFTDFDNFRLLTGAQFPDPTEVVPTAFGGVDPGPAYTAPPAGGVSIGAQSEATLDVTRAGSVAPGANLLLVVSSAAANNNDGIGADAQYLVQTTPVPAQIISISFGACETSAGSSGVAFWDTLFQQAAAEGISVFVASGDSGAAGCDTAFAAPPGTPTANSPNYICSSSYATCAGGTEFNDTANPAHYWSSTNQSNLGSALSYIPEGAWNEPLNSKSATQVAATGGGVSAYIATPFWQTGTGVPAAQSGRYTPDISFSSSCHDAYFACLAAGGASCVPNSSGEFYFEGFCGTSAAAPSMAGVAALLDQKLGGSQGNLNPALYETATASPVAFHDSTIASSGITSCDVNTPSTCNNSAAAAQPGYLLTTGYDEATGLGSLDVASFLTNLSSTLFAPTVTVTPSATSITAAQPLSVSVTVTGGDGNPVPTGSVTLFSGVYFSAATPLVNGAATINIPGGSLQVGGDTLTVQYQPDTASSSTYKSASGTSSVADGLPSPAVTITTNVSTLSTSDYLFVTVQASGGSGSPTVTGTVSVHAIPSSGSGTYTVSAPLSVGTAEPQFLPGTLPAGSYQIEAFYTPDAQSRNIYASAQSNSVAVTVTQGAKSTPLITAGPYTPLAVLPLYPLTVQVSVTGTASTSATPTGTVVLTTGSYNSGPVSLYEGFCLINLPAGTLPAGADILAVSYSGDANFNATTGSSTLTVSYPPKATPTISLNSPTPAVTPNESFTETISVSPASNYPAPTGTVTLSSGNYSSGPLTLVTGTGLTSATATIPGGALPTGTDTLTASYSGDNYYNAATGSTTTEVANPSLTITGTAVTISAPGGAATSTVTATPVGPFSGNVHLTAVITSTPAESVDPPTLSLGTQSMVTVSSPNPAYIYLKVATTAPTQSSLTAPQVPSRRWYAAGGATLACIIFIWVPRRSRNLRNLLGTFALLVFLAGGVLACGGGGATSTGGSGSSGGSGGSGGPTPGTTPGNYTITITGTSGTTTAAGTLTLTVQ